MEVREGRARSAEWIDNLGFIPMRLCPCPRFEDTEGSIDPKLAKISNVGGRKHGVQPYTIRCAAARNAPRF
jgi:hypothetical protein